MGVSALLAVSVASAYMSYESGEQAKKSSKENVMAQKEGLAAQQRQSDIEAQRARIAQIRESRIRQAQVLASTGGVSGSSGTEGAIASIGSQVSNNIGNIGVNQSIAAEVSSANQRAADASGKMAEASAIGQQWQAIGNVSSTIFSAAGGFKTIFGNKIKPAK